MEEKLNFSLPPKRQSTAAASRILIVLLLILIGLTALNLMLRHPGGEQAPDATALSLSAEETKELANKLTQRNLHTRAAKAWQDYLSVGELSDAERAKILFQIGTLLEKANLYDQAIEYYYRSEAVAELSELSSQINAHVKDCFEKLGKFSALRYELMDRTSLGASSEAGTKVVAEMGAEKISEADLDAIIENDIENQLEPVAPFMTAEQLNEQKKRMLEQYKEPQAKQQYLQVWLTQEVLYRQALQEGLMEDPEAKKLVDQLMRGAFSQLLMNRELASKINITETDLRTYYTANKDKFVEPSKARISHILVDDEQEAKDLIGRIKNGEDFAELAKQFTKDEDTKQNGGKIDAEVSQGSYVPVIGTYAELNDKIFAVAAPALLDEPYMTEKGWEVVKVETVTAERQKELDEVRQQVMSMLASQKRQDVQRDYIGQLMDKYGVIIHTTAFGGSEDIEQKGAAGAVTQ